MAISFGQVDNAQLQAIRELLSGASTLHFQTQLQKMQLQKEAEDRKAVSDVLRGVIPNNFESYNEAITKLLGIPSQRAATVAQELIKARPTEKQFQIVPHETGIRVFQPSTGELSPPVPGTEQPRINLVQSTREVGDKIEELVTGLEHRTGKPLFTTKIGERTERPTPEETRVSSEIMRNLTQYANANAYIKQIESNPQLKTDLEEGLKELSKPDAPPILNQLASGQMDDATYAAFLSQLFVDPNDPKALRIRTALDYLRTKAKRDASLNTLDLMESLTGKKIPKDLWDKIGGRPVDVQSTPASSASTQTPGKDKNDVLQFWFGVKK